MIIVGNQALGLNHKLPILLSLLLLLVGCISSRHDVQLSCSDNIHDARVLVPEIHGPSAHQSERLFEVITGELAKTGVKPLYYPAEEWTLTSKGIVPNDRKLMAGLASDGIPFLLIVDVVESKSGAVLEYLSADQINARFASMNRGYVPPIQNATSHSVSILVSVVATDRNQQIYRSLTRTNVNPVSLRDGNAGEVQVNAGSTSLALQKAVKKGIRNLKKKCLTKG